MARSKYINTFDTTAEYNNYIESALPSFPNVGYDKEADKVNIVRTSPNDHVWYGEVVDPSQALPTISLDGTEDTPILDEINNAFYLDTWSNAAPTRISFGNNSNIKTIKKMQIDTSNVTSMYYMLGGCPSLTSLDLSNFNTSNVTTTESMFSGSSSLTSLDLSNFDTSNVTNMKGMFSDCSSLTSLDLSNFDTSNVTDIGGMFSDCSSLTSLDLSNFDTSNVINTTYMFSRCTSLTSLNLSNWDGSKFYNSPTFMFMSCSKLKDVYITVEATLNKLTNNLTSQGNNCIPSSATIHYNGVDYKWQNNRWTPQS